MIKNEDRTVEFNIGVLAFSRVYCCSPFGNYNMYFVRQNRFNRFRERPIFRLYFFLPYLPEKLNSNVKIIAGVISREGMWRKRMPRSRVKALEYGYSKILFCGCSIKVRFSRMIEKL